MRRLVFSILLVACGLIKPALAETCHGPGTWVRWDAFQAQMITGEGRVVDHSDERSITTSEGQSYGLFFALVDNDQELFNRLLRWTERNLARNDLTSFLPAWLWGRLPDGQWGVLDTNTASDSNLWIAYTLLEAGRLWKQHTYTVLGTLMLQRMAREEVARLPGFGTLLLPGLRGFVHQGYWRLNPSYLPPQVLARISVMQANAPWVGLVRDAHRFLIDSAPLGLAPDWANWTGQRFEALSEADHIGSYDGIRVYLWVGMMHDDTPGATELKRHFRAVERLVAPSGNVSERVNVVRGDARGEGPPGFSAALLPLFEGREIAGVLRNHLKAKQSAVGGYYSQALVLFGEGWDQKRYRFERDGALAPSWTVCR